MRHIENLCYVWCVCVSVASRCCNFRYLNFQCWFSIAIASHEHTSHTAHSSTTHTSECQSPIPSAYVCVLLCVFGKIETFSLAASNTLTFVYFLFTHATHCFVVSIVEVIVFVVIFEKLPQSRKQSRRMTKDNVISKAYFFHSSHTLTHPFPFSLLQL